MKTGNVILGVLAGVAVGATVGILFAPARGKSTRRKITRKSDEFVNGIKEKFNDFLGSVTKKFEDFKEEATLMAENEEKKAEDMDTEISNVVK